MSATDTQAGRPTATDRECLICHATVAAWPDVMVCHCHTVPWKRVAGGGAAADRALEALKWANDRLRDVGQQVDFSLGMCMTLAESEKRHAAALAQPQGTCKCGCGGDPFICIESDGVERAALAQPRPAVDRAAIIAAILHVGIGGGSTFDSEDRQEMAGEWADAILALTQPPTVAKGDEQAIRDRIINTPETADFMAGVPIEAAHQRERWGSDHDAGKSPFDWYWLIGYLAQKAADAAVRGNADKAMHHTISTAAALANWHAALTGVDTSMRPGIEPPTAQGDAAGEAE